MAHLLGLIPEGSVKGFDWFKPKFKPENLVYIGIFITIFYLKLKFCLIYYLRTKRY